MIWRPTFELQFYTRVTQSGPADSYGFARHRTKDVLQQKWIAEDGTEEWRDVPHSGTTCFN